MMITDNFVTNLQKILSIIPFLSLGNEIGVLFLMPIRVKYLGI